LRRLAHELEIFSSRAVSHDALDAGAVVPRPVEEDHFAAGRKMRDVPLEIPLRGLALRRFLQCDDACAAGVEMFHEPLDGAAFASGVTALEQDHDARAGGLDPVLQL